MVEVVVQDSGDWLVRHKWTSRSVLSLKYETLVASSFH